MDSSTAFVYLCILCVFESVLCNCYERGCCTECSSEKGPIIYPVTPPAILAEGPHWDSAKQVLYFVDQLGRTFNKYDPKTGNTTTTHLDQQPGGIIPLQNTSDSFVAGLVHDLVILKWDGISNRSTYQVIDTVERNRVSNRFDDGKADINGVLWIGTLNLRPNFTVTPNGGHLYHYSLKKCQLVRDLTVTISNGIAWNKDYTLMYYIDTPTLKIVVFDYNLETSRISNPRPVFAFNDFDIPGAPDSMTIDIQDNLWVASFLGSRVIRIDPRNGKLLFTIYFPVEQVTNVAFGGPNLDVLYVTTAKVGLNETQLAQQPDAGSIFAVCGLKVKGRPANNAIVCHP